MVLLSLEYFCVCVTANTACGYCEIAPEYSSLALETMIYTRSTSHHPALPEVVTTNQNEAIFCRWKVTVEKSL